MADCWLSRRAEIGHGLIHVEDSDTPGFRRRQLGPYNRFHRVDIERLWIGIYCNTPDLGALIGDRLKGSQKVHEKW